MDTFGNLSISLVFRRSIYLTRCSDYSN